MDLKKYIKTSENASYLTSAYELGASKALLEAIKVKKQELQKALNEKPERNDKQLNKDVVYVLGQINALAWTMDLPLKVRERAKKLPQGDVL